MQIEVRIQNTSPQLIVLYAQSQRYLLPININKHVTSACSATVLTLLTAIVYKCSQSEAPVSGYDGVPEYLKYLIRKNCIFCGGTIQYCYYI